jgi:hypothetical protein
LQSHAQQLGAAASARKKSRVERAQAGGHGGHEMTTPGESEMSKNTGEPCWGRRRGKRRAARRPGAAATGSQTAAEAVQLAIGLLTASLDSPQLQAQAIEMLIPEPAALGDLLAGLHIVSQLLLHQLHEATGQPAAATLQGLAILSEIRRDPPSTGRGSAEQPGT